jgi:hypothetical protein
MDGHAEGAMPHEAAPVPHRRDGAHGGLVSPGASCAWGLRELERTVSQIFEVSLILSSSLALVDEPAAQRIDDAIRRLDDIIQDARTAVLGHALEDTERT